MEGKPSTRDWRTELKRAEESGIDDDYFGLILKAHQAGLSDEEIANLTNPDGRSISDLGLADDLAWQQLTEREK